MQKICICSVDLKKKNVILSCLIDLKIFNENNTGIIVGVIFLLILTYKFKKMNIT